MRVGEPVAEETMDTQAQIEALNASLRLQMRSALQYALAAGSMFGFEYQSLAGSLGEFAAAELEDARGTAPPLQPPPRESEAARLT